MEITSCRDGKVVEQKKVSSELVVPFQKSTSTKKGAFLHIKGKCPCLHCLAFPVALNADTIFSIIFLRREEIFKNNDELFEAFDSLPDVFV